MTFEEALEKNGKIVYTNVGVSMMPLIREGKDIMVIEKITKPLKKYDTVLFRRPEIQGRGEYVLHRILGIKDGEYFIIGDNCLGGEMVKEENILGILTQLKRDGKIIHVTDSDYLRYVHLWWAIFPLRSFLTRCRNFAGRWKRRLIKWLKK